MHIARNNIKTLLSESSSPAVLSSFGKDSLLLLALVRELRSDIPVLWFKAAASAEQTALARRVIREWRLNVYSYHPADMYLLTNGGQVSMVQEYSVGVDRLPLVVDVVHGPTCSLQATARTPQIFLPFDLLLVGYKDTDDHWTKGGVPLFADDLQLGPVKVRAPIRHMTDTAVYAALAELHITHTEVNDALQLCTACMTSKDDRVWCSATQAYIPREQWDTGQSLSAFRHRLANKGELK